MLYFPTCFSMELFGNLAAMHHRGGHVYCNPPITSGVGRPTLPRARSLLRECRLRSTCNLSVFVKAVPRFGRSRGSRTQGSFLAATDEEKEEVEPREAKHRSEQQEQFSRDAADYGLIRGSHSILPRDTPRTDCL